MGRGKRTQSRGRSGRLGSACSLAAGCIALIGLGVTVPRVAAQGVPVVSNWNPAFSVGDWELPGAWIHTPPWPIGHLLATDSPNALAGSLCFVNIATGTINKESAITSISGLTLSGDARLLMNSGTIDSLGVIVGPLSTIEFNAGGMITTLDYRN